MFQVKKVFDILYERDIIRDTCVSYGEPGYEDPEILILVGDWNKISHRLYSWLEKQGYSLEWEDEWICSRSGKMYRTTPDSYAWKPSYIFTEDGEILGVDEMEDDEALELYADILVNNPRRADTMDQDWSRLGFNLQSCEFQAGWYGRNDTPDEILEKAKDYDVIFQISESGQFHTDFCVWTKERSF